MSSRRNAACGWIMGCPLACAYGRRSDCQTTLRLHTLPGADDARPHTSGGHQGAGLVKTCCASRQTISSRCSLIEDAMGSLQYALPRVTASLHFNCPRPCHCPFHRWRSRVPILVMRSVVSLSGENDRLDTSCLAKLFFVPSLFFFLAHCARILHNSRETIEWTPAKCLMHVQAIFYAGFAIDASMACVGSGQQMHGVSLEPSETVTVYGGAGREP